jgi:hypothetical protein
LHCAETFFKEGDMMRLIPLIMPHRIKYWSSGPYYLNVSWACRLGVASEMPDHGEMVLRNLRYDHQQQLTKLQYKTVMMDIICDYFF